MVPCCFFILKLIVDRLIVATSGYQSHIRNFVKPLFINSFCIIKHYNRLTAYAVTIRWIFRKLCGRCIITDSVFLFSKIKGGCLWFLSDGSVFIIIVKLIIPHIHRTMGKECGRCCILANHRCFRICIITQYNSLGLTIFSRYSKLCRI